MFLKCSQIAPALAAAIALSVGARADNWLTGPYAAAVDHVVDGDTIAVRAAVWVDVDVDVGVRLEGIDAPEVSRAACDAERARGEAARAFVEELARETLILEDVRHDKYAGRVVARVMTPEGRNLSEALLEAGLARPWDPEAGEPKPDWCADDPPT